MGFNLSEWALNNRSLTVYLMIVAVVAGLFAFVRLGRNEDPSFVIKTMVVQAAWPGASVDDMLKQVTERLERTLQETPKLDFLRSFTRAGVTTIFVNLKDSTGAREIPDIWYHVRKSIGDMRHTPPAGVVGPGFNDEFGDTFGIIYGFTADGFTHRELRDYVEDVRSKLLQVRDVSKIEILGAQDEKIFVEFSMEELASLGIDRSALISALQAQNVVQPAGTIQTGKETLSLRVSGAFRSEEDVANVNFAVGGRMPSRAQRCGEERRTQVRDDIYLVDVITRATDEERISLDTLRSIQVPLANGRTVPLSQFASFTYDQEQPLIWRRDRVPTLTVQADVKAAVLPATVVDALAPSIAELNKTLPRPYRIALGGVVEDSAKAQASVVAVVPAMLLIMFTVLMVQLRSFSRLFIVLSVGPLGLIGVVGALLLSGKPLGFVAILGILALLGMITKNAVILIGQIEAERSQGKDIWQATVDASSTRFRPIMLTAISTVLGMIPIAPTVFWGPMAFAIMGGLLVGTILTLVFLPTLYVAWFRAAGYHARPLDARHIAILSRFRPGQPGFLSLRPGPARHQSAARCPRRFG